MRIWDPASGAQIGQPLVGHSDVVSSAAFGRLRSGTPVIVLGSYDGTVRLWNAVAVSLPCK